MRGRKKKPTALVLLEGNRGKRKLPANEPKPEPIDDLSRAPAPAILDHVAKLRWQKVVRDCVTVGILTPLDLDQLAVYCQKYSTWIKASKKVDALGEVIVGSRGTLIKNPWLRIRDEADAAMRKIAEHYGFTPATRPRIPAKPPEPPDADPAESYF
jgi:P27 family predicted phage terminase small subunit